MLYPNAEEGRLDDISNEAKSIQNGLKRGKIKPRSANKKNLEKIRFIKAVRIGDIRGATRSIDPDNFSVLEWDDEVKNILRAKFPTSNNLILDRSTNDPKFKSTKIDTMTIYSIIKNLDHSRVG